MSRTSRAAGRLDWWAMGVLVAFTLISILGFWSFALHPERIPSTPLAGRVYAVSFQFFGQVHIVLAAAALIAFLVRRAGIRWIPLLLVVYLISWGVEHLGTRFGVPFGSYRYTDLLGMKLDGRVPILIPLSWFLMALPSWVISRRAFPRSSQRGIRVVLGSAWMVVWDLSLDPAMSHLTPYWRWAEEGAFYGMPAVNLLGWGTTALLLMGVMEWLAERTKLWALPLDWVAAYYATVLLMPLGMIAAAGLWPAVLATLSGVAALTALSLREPQSTTSMKDVGSEPAWTS
jgi:uncharacterized membrane protein